MLAPCRFVAATALASMVAASTAYAHGELTVVSWGGSYARSQMLAYIEPFREQGGEWVNMETYNGGLDEIRAQVDAANVTWDVVDFELSDLVRGCQEGLMVKLDTSFLAPAPDGTAPAEDFMAGALTECGIGQTVWSTVFAYDQEQITGDGPTTIADFFDVQQFPGPRGLRRDPRVNLEWALMADGVPAEQVYAALATAEGVERAFAMLDRIKPHVVWWQDGAEPAALLENDEVAMTSVWNGRMFRPIVEDGRPFTLVWDGQIWDIDSWGIVKGSGNLDQARQFIRFATSTEQLAEQTKHISYGPARQSAMALVAEPVAAMLPTAADNMANALQSDALWWAEHHGALTAAFDAWLEDSADRLSGVAR